MPGWIRGGALVRTGNECTDSRLASKGDRGEGARVVEVSRTRETRRRTLSQIPRRCHAPSDGTDLNCGPAGWASTRFVHDVRRMELTECESIRWRSAVIGLQPSAGPPAGKSLDAAQRTDAMTTTIVKRGFKFTPDFKVFPFADEAVCYLKVRCWSKDAVSRLARRVGAKTSTSCGAMTRANNRFRLPRDSTWITSP